MKINLLSNQTRGIKSFLLMLLGIVSITFSFAQPREAVIGKASVTPVVDGMVDQVWAQAAPMNIALSYRSETPTLGTLGQTWWKGLWTDEGIFVLVNVTDNVFSPPYLGTDPATSWMYDKVEIYFDCNYIKKDGLGADRAQGHYCYAPVATEDMLKTGLAGNANFTGSTYCYKLNGQSYVAEYYIPFSDLLDKDRFAVDKTAPIGFDITIIDNDVKSPMRNRMVWANAGRIDENWSNMDDAGLIALEPSSYNELIPIEKIFLTPGSITTKRGTLQMVPVLEPSWASMEKIQWSVINGTGKASISPTGMVTALSNGIVTVKATAKEEPYAEAFTTVTISGQPAEGNDPWNTVNLIQNWDFTSDLTHWGSWVDMAVPGQQVPVVENGVVKMTTGKSPDGNYWHYQFNQQFLQAEANVPYILKFKSWSSVDRTNRVDFEDTPENVYTRYGASTDAQAIKGRSEWQYNTTTEPQWFTFHVVFDQIKPTTVQKIQWMLSNDNAVTYLDSVLLMKEDSTQTVPHFLTLSTTQIIMDAGEGTAAVDIASDVSWTAHVDQVWLKLSTTAGTGNRSLILTAQANTLTNARTATITVKANGLATQTLTVTQHAKPIPPGEHGQPTCGQKWSDEVWNYQNLIKNWNFTNDLTYWGFYMDTAAPGQSPPVAENGVAVLHTANAPDGNNWHYQLNQYRMQAEANVPYILKFKSWSSAPRSNGLAFEDTPENNYARYGASPDAEAINGRAEWTYYTTAEPRWYTFHVVFDRIKPTTIQKIQWMLSTADATTYLDSVILVKGTDSIVVNDDYLILSKNRIFLEDHVAVASFAISSNTNWEVRTDQPWLYIDRPLGTGNRTITLTATANTWYTNRSATVTVYIAGQEAQTISVIQNAKQGLPDEPSDSIPAEHWTTDAWNDYNLIKNWDFSSGLNEWGSWVDYNFTGPLLPAVVNGTAQMNTIASPDGYSWHYQLLQNGLQAEPGVPYTLRFKCWSDIPRSNALVFEDSPENGYNRYGASTDAESLNGRSEWIYFTSARPRWYTFHVVFDQMTPSTVQKIQWMLSTADAITYLDSVILIKDSDLLMVKEAQLALSASHLEVDHTETQQLIDISSNTNAMAISDQQWLTVYPPLVTGSKTIEVTAQANPTNQKRTATVTLYPAGMKSKTITVTQGSITGIKPIQEDQQLKIFPNPTTGKIKLVMGQAPQKGTYLAVYDLTGKLILRQPIVSKEQWMDLKGNPPGIYLLKSNLNDWKVQRIMLK